MVDPPRRTGAMKSGTATFGPSGAGIWSTPTVDPNRGVMYVTTGDNYSHPATASFYVYRCQPEEALEALGVQDGVFLFLSRWGRGACEPAVSGEGAGAAEWTSSSSSQSSSSSSPASMMFQAYCRAA